MSFIYSFPDSSPGTVATAEAASHMPAEWETHHRTWMAFPPPNGTFGQVGSSTLDRARAAWSNVARTISRREPVTVVADPRDATAAREWLGEGITVVEVPLDDAWIRDSGPTFVHCPDGSLAAVDWVFNGWGAQGWAAWEKDRHVAGAVAGHAGVPAVSSALVNEGGGFHVDGEGTVLLHRQDDPAHPDHDVCRELHAVPASTVVKDDEGYADWSNINHYVANNVVVLCNFDDPNDTIAAGILERAYPGRAVKLVDARDILAFGGGIHCITQQQPARATEGRTQ